MELDILGACLPCGFTRHKGFWRQYPRKFEKTSGKATKVFKVKKSGFYDFNLDNELESGNVTVSLIDSLGNKVFELNKMNGFSSDYLNESEKYRLVFNYNKACGKFELSWK